MKQNLKSTEVFHFWANKIQSYGRCGNVFFENGIIYSYGYHFPIAKHVEGKNAILMTTRGYSNTTAKHISKVRQSIPSYVSVTYCHNPANLIEHNFNMFESELKKIVDKLASARKPEKYINEIINKKLNIEKFADVLNVKIPKSIIKLFDFADVDSNTELLEKLKESKRKEQEKREKEQAKRIKDFQSFKLKELDIYNLGEKTYLRINKGSECIETSKGISIPFAIAERTYRFIKNYLTAPEIPLQYKILHYTVNEITSKNITVGCHFVTMSEVERIAKLMKW